MSLDLGSLPTDPEQFGGYLLELSDEQLISLDQGLTQRFAALKDDPDILDEDGVESLTALKGQIDACRAETAKRQSAAANKRAEDAAAAHRAAIEDLAASVFGTAPAPAAKGGDGAAAPGDADAVESLAAVIADAISRGVQRAQPSMTAAAGRGFDLNQHVRQVPLGEIARRSPDPKVAPARREAVLVASADIPGVAKNGRVDGIRQLVTLMGDRSRMLSVTRGKPNYVPVAKLVREFRYRLNLDSTPDEINEVITAATDTAALVAAGGWCAPSEISYDFYNVVCEDGMLDLPSVGILNRGGFRFPTSPTIADIFADPNVIWSWTEAQDISAALDGDVKTCARVPCPDFQEVRAACDGLCVTAGNLTTFAYPEMVENYLRLVMAGRAHRTNQIIIQQLVAASDAVSMVGSGEGTTASVLNAVDLQAVDYRERFRMCGDAILEAVFPRWTVNAIRADLANRNGLALFQVTMGMIADWFNDRNIRVQFVADWQSGFDADPIGDPDTFAVMWPASVGFLLYAPGTFVRGQALQLDLGVVRDSVLNEKNDHTAAWMEDCYAVAEVGHESRLVTTDVCPFGETGAAALACGS